MNATRKRPAGAALHRPPAKQPRLTMRAADGGNPSPGGNASANDRLRARWVAHFATGLKNGWSFAQGTVELVVDTLFSPSPALPMYNSDQRTRNIESPVPAVPPLPTPPTSPSYSSGELPVVRKNVIPSPSSSVTPVDAPPALLPPPVIVAAVPWPTTANTQTPYPEIDNELRRHHQSVRRQHKRATRNHIFAKQVRYCMLRHTSWFQRPSSHKMHVQAAVAGAREELMKELYILNQRNGYSSDFATFKGFMQKQALIKRYMRSRSSSFTDLGRHTKTNSEDDTDFLRRAIEKAQATLNGPKPLKPLTPSINQLQFKYRSKDNELERRMRPPPLPTALPPADDAKVTELLSKSGVISKYAREQVSDQDILRLKPNKWLNDEVINFYGALILGRSEASKENPVTNGKPAKEKKPLDVHYFSTFFWTKLEKEGYEKGRLAKWTKKIDIFTKDTILIPVNHQNRTGFQGELQFLRPYFDLTLGLSFCVNISILSTATKKKTPFDFTGWEDYTSDDTPMQENGFDCGVFTCQFLESLSRGEESFNFSQKDILYLRRRMVWEIGNATLRTEH
ncbi:Cysteine proteinase [Mycena venus]|uniref:Cysteine proteinase n=1 Tax=Mycena venus TaxID=2733690 RepID=A0A8H6XEX1_9AGAR|nr:Cysteine proteinase [Mycena venus]